MPYFDEAAVMTFEEGLERGHCNQDRLRTRLVFREYRTDKGREHACHGLLRRTDLLLHSIDRIFEAIPPDLVGIPSRAACQDATAHLQAACFNTFGCLDNLAWLWVHEKGIAGQAGAALRPTQVGLGRKYTYVRASFSAQLIAYVDGIEPWLNRLVTYRDALAHRVPLYVPPYAVLLPDVPEYQALEQAEIFAYRDGKREDLKRIALRMAELKSFQPVIAASFDEGIKPILFHPQVIADHATIIELAGLVFAELDRAS